MVILRTINNLPVYAKNFISLMGRSNVLPIDFLVLVKEFTEALIITILYPVVSFVGLYLQFIRWIWVMLFRVTVPPPQQLSSGIQIKSCILTGITSSSEDVIGSDQSGNANSNQTLSMAYSLAKSLCYSWMKILRQNAGEQEHRMITLVGPSDQYLTEMRENLIRELGETFVKNIEIRVKVCEANDEDKIRKVVTEYDYDLVIACQPCGYITTSASEYLNEKVSQKQQPKKRDTKGTQQEDRKNKNVSFGNRSGSSGEDSDNFPQLTIIGEETIRQQFNSIIQPTLNTILPAIKQANERGVTDSPKHVVVGLVNEVDPSVSNNFVNDFSLQLPKAIFHEISNLINRSLRRETFSSVIGNNTLRNQLVETDFPSKSQLVFQLINPIVNTTSRGSGFRNLFTRNSSPSSNTQNGNYRLSNRASSEENNWVETFPTNLSDEIMKEIYEGIECVDVNRPVQYGFKRLVNALPLSVNNVLSSILDL